MRPGTLGRTGDSPEITHVGHTVEQHDERRLVLGDPLQDVLQPDILDGRGLRHDSLMIAARQAVELLDRHLLKMHPMADAEVFELLHQLPLGAFADVEFFDLLSGLDRLGHGTDPENDIIHCIVLR